MFCSNCGNEIVQGSKFCPKCGRTILKESVPLQTNVSKVQKFRIGRLGRLAFGISMLISFSIIFLLILLNAPEGLATTFVCINFAWMIIIYVGRLHDIGYSGGWFILVMITSLLGIVALISWPGDKQPNKYGNVPPSQISHLLRFWKS